MKTYCVKCRKDAKNIDQKWLEQQITDQLCNQNCGIKKSRFVKEQVPNGLLRNLGYTVN